MKKKDIEQLSLLYEFINQSTVSPNIVSSRLQNNIPGHGDGGRPPIPPDDYDGGGDDDDDDDDDFDHDNSPYKDAVFDESNPKADAAYRQLVDDMYSKNVITLERFWNLFSVMYGMHPVKDAPPYKDWKSSLRHAVYKVQQDFPDFQLDIEIEGHGSVYLKDEG